MEEIVLSPNPVPLGASGIAVAPIAWGMWRFAGRSVGDARALVEAALAAGITLLDTADIYGFDGSGGFGDAETLLGKVLAEAPELRGRMVLATKGGIRPPLPYNSSATYLTEALDASLRRLGVEQVDLYQVHRPDVLTHPEALAATLDAMVDAGKVRAIGVSNYTPAQAAALARYLSTPLVSHQNEFSPLALEPLTGGLLDQAAERRMAVLAWSPLGGGRIAEPGTAQERAVAAALDQVAGAAGVSRSVAAYSWIMAHPARPVPIVGSQDAGRIAEAAEVFTVRWTREQWYAVLAAARGERLP